MGHQRIRPYKADLGDGVQMDMAMAVRAGKHVYIRGLTALGPDGKVVGVGDGAAQAEQCMQTAKALLEEAGSSVEHICKIHTYITDRAWRVPVYQTVGKWIKGVFPCGTGIIVNGLPRAEMVVMLDIAAVSPD